jgi:Zn-dependent metalloprotease/subtilisin-like proprotein convertase family protein
MNRWSYQLAVLAGSTVAVLTALASAQGQVARPEGATPEIDQRRAAKSQLRATLSPEQHAAGTALKRQMPDVLIRLDSLLGTPKSISRRRGFLTGPDEAAAGDPHRPLRNFLNQHATLFGHGAEALDRARIRRDYVTKHNGMRTVIWQQELDGIPIYQSLLKAHISGKGELITVSSLFVPDPAKAALAGSPNRSRAIISPKVTAVEAIARAAGSLGDNLSVETVRHLEGKPRGAGYESYRAADLKGTVYVRRTWLPMNRDAMRLCWEVLLASRAQDGMFSVLIDCDTGEVLVRQSRTRHISDATYRVFTSDSPSPFTPGHADPSSTQPALVTRSLVTLSAIDTNASPNGWIDDGGNETLGNNVDAHTDLEDDDDPDLPRPAGSPSRVFNPPLNLTVSPTVYRSASVVQLFYWNNWMHDQLYLLGFTEEAGNFQTDNFGRGGDGDDAVQADCQDGGGVNKANFSTPDDGIEPRMQMYVWNGPNPDRDGSLDAEIVLHEYTHGLSDRLVGGGNLGYGAINQPGGLGEGWSDFYALALLSESSDDVDGNYPMGGYSTYLIGGENFTENYYYGIRRYPYTTDMTKNPLTFKDIDPTQASGHAGIPINPILLFTYPGESHAAGEVWCSALWEVRAALIKKYGFATGNQLALQLVTDGMALTPAEPTFLDARDAILLADEASNDGENFLEIWTAFAKRGMGLSALAPDSSTTEGVLEAFDIPGLVVESAFFEDANGNGGLDPNECSTLHIVLRNDGDRAATNVSAVLSSSTIGATVTDRQSAYPDVLIDQVATNMTAFQLNTAPYLICGELIDLRLTVTSSQGITSLPVRFNTGGLTRYDNNNPVFIPDFSTRVSEILVSGFSNTLGHVVLSLHITHPFPEDLVLSLSSPDGTTVTLSENNGVNSLFFSNYGSACSPDSQRTTFDDNASQSISNGVPPFLGSYRPEEQLLTFAGKPSTLVNGIWSLAITDNVIVWSGRLECWSLLLSQCEDGPGLCVAPDLTGHWAQLFRRFGTQRITGRFVVRNAGQQRSGATTVRFYLSDNATFDGTDRFLLSRDIGELGRGSITFANFTLTLPADVTAEGKYGIAVVDLFDAVEENDEFNNVVVFGPIP